MTTSHRQTPTLSELLAREGMTQRELAQRVDADQASVNRWVHRRNIPHRFYRVAIAEVFGLKEEQIAWRTSK